MKFSLRSEESEEAICRQIALDGVHFELQQGERLGLLGPNGAGKTTLVRCLARRIRADEGEIQILGRRWHPEEPVGLRCCSTRARDLRGLTATKPQVLWQDSWDEWASFEGKSPLGFRLDGFI